MTLLREVLKSKKEADITAKGSQIVERHICSSKISTLKRGSQVEEGSRCTNQSRSSKVNSSESTMEFVCIKVTALSGGNRCVLCSNVFEDQAGQYRSRLMR